MSNFSKRFLILVVLAYVLYILGALFQVTLWAGLMAPVFDLLAAGLIFRAILTSKNKAFRQLFILCGAAVIAWALGDTLWFIDLFVFHVNPSNDLLVSSFYFCTNLLFVVAAVYFAFNWLQKWDMLQLVTDSLSFSLAVLWLFWVMLYKKQTDIVYLLMNNSVFNSIEIIMDAFLIVAAGTWYLSIRMGKTPLFLRSIISAIVLFAIADLFYYNQFIHGFYTPDKLVDIVYLGTLLMLSVSIQHFYHRYPIAYGNPHPSTNIGTGHKGVLLLLCPLLIYAVGYLELYDVVFYLLLVLFHEYTTTFIQRGINQKKLLHQEHEMNVVLEQRVSEQTQSLKDINTDLQNKNTQLQYINRHDLLTGLYNRAYFLQWLEELVGNCGAGESVVLVIWNIDKLKVINSTYGYATGDRLLAWHAGQVKEQFQDSGMLARLGSDDFAYAEKGNFQASNVIPVAARALDACKKPLHIGEYVFNITVSAGACLFPQCSPDAEALLKNADIAMRSAKKDPSGRRIARYIDVNEAVKRKIKIANQLKSAHYDKELSLCFQPQFCMDNRALVGVEALLRWNCPGLGPVSPTEFIPIAEEENLIIPIGKWVMENAIRQITVWNTAHQTDLRMGINFSPRQLGQIGTLEELRELIEQYHARYNWIDIEITESVALDNEDDAGKIKRFFQDSGITISIDDFGTGYSSLGYLTILSFDRLKIAKPLVDKITFDDSCRKIVTSIILLAKSLGLKTLCEGVETKEQFDLLLKLGCEQIQGFYLGKPMPPGVFEALFLTAVAKPQPVQ